MLGVGCWVLGVGCWVLGLVFVFEVGLFPRTRLNFFLGLA